MTSSSIHGLLTPRDPGPVHIVNPSGGSSFLLLGDHAGNRVPERLAGLGLAAASLERHIALDIGISQVGRRLSAALDSCFIEQRYSRLVIDCNRAPGHPESLVPVSDGTVVPGNIGVSQSDAEHRVEEIFRPYHAAIAGLLVERAASGQPTILTSLHSFTPRLGGVARPWEIGVLYSGGDARFAAAALAALQAVDGLSVGDNAPYEMDETDFTVPTHAFATGVPYVELDIRQDLIADEQRRQRIVRIVEKALREAAAVPTG